MAVEVKHSTIVAVPDDGTSPVGSDEWNATHQLTQAGQRMLGKPSAGAGATEEMDGAAVRSFAGAEVAGAAAAAVSAHEAAADPHPTYITAAEGETVADARIAAASINALADVAVSAPVTGQVLKWDGSAWVNGTDATGGGGAAAIKSALVSIPYGVNRASVTVVDAAIAPGMNIIATQGATVDTDENEQEMDAVLFSAVAQTGQFLLTVASAARDRIGGAFRIAYTYGT